MSRILGGVIVAAVLVSTIGAGYAMDAAGADTSDRVVLGPGLVTVTVDIDYSTFDFDGSGDADDVDELHVRQGTTVRFVVHNRDPINHEFVVGDAAVHATHEQGSEKVHPPVPGEVSVPARTTGVTFYEFVSPGTFRYACHLPGHVAYGMEGEVIVVP